MRVWRPLIKGCTANGVVAMFTRARDFISFQYPLERYCGGDGPRNDIILPYLLGVVECHPLPPLVAKTTRNRDSIRTKTLLSSAIENQSVILRGGGVCIIYNTECIIHYKVRIRVRKTK